MKQEPQELQDTPLCVPLCVYRTAHWLPRTDHSESYLTGCPQRQVATQSENPSSYKAVIEANESGGPAVEKLAPFHPGLVVIVAVRGGHLKGALCTPHLPV